MKSDWMKERGRGEKQSDWMKQDSENESDRVYDE